MSKSRSIRKPGVRGERLGVRGKADEPLPRIGETPEEIQAALVRGMRDLLDGRITVKEANRIAHAANMQLHRLRVMDWLARMAKRKEGPRSKRGSVQVSKGKSGTPRWVN